MRYRLSQRTYADWNEKGQGSVLQRAKVLDLSEDGISLLGGAPIEAGRTVQLSLHLGDSGNEISIKVQGVWSDSCGRSGLRFVESSSAALLSVREYLFFDLISRYVAWVRQDANSVPEPCSTLCADYPGRLAVLNCLRQEVAFLGSDFQAGLSLIADAAQRLLQASASAVAVATQNPEVLVCRATVGAAAPPPGTKLHIGMGFSGLCVRQGTPLICTDSDRDTRVDAEQCRALGVRSLLAVPVVCGSSILGLIEVFSSHASAFTNEDTVVLERLAEIILDIRNRSAASQTGIGSFPSKLTPFTSPPIRRNGSAQVFAAYGDHQVSRFGARAIVCAVLLATAVFGLSSLWIQPQLQSKRSQGPAASKSAPYSSDPSAARRTTEALFKSEEIDLTNLERMARAGDADAENNLGLRYLAGDAWQGLKPDEREAAQWFSRAAEQGNVAAQARLGYLFWSGRGVPQNLEKAYFWAAVASQNSSASSPEPAVSLAKVLKQVLGRSSLTPAQATALDRKAERWRPRRNL